MNGWQDFLIKSASYVSGAALVAILTLVGRGIVRRYRERGRRALFTGLERPSVFVFPTRTGEEKRLLPNTAIEDFLAINNIISAYLHADLIPPDKLRDHTNLDNAMRNSYNLILICSSKSNNVTRDALLALPNLIKPSHRDLIPTFVPNPSGLYQIHWNGGTFDSPSYAQQGPRYDDTAVIIKARNPWSPDPNRKILIVAGIRGIGTWGAAELLKKGWKNLLAGWPKQSPTGDFVALVRVRYEALDIKGFSVSDVKGLDNAYLENVGS